MQSQRMNPTYFTYQQPSGSSVMSLPTIAETSDHHHKSTIHTCQNLTEQTSIQTSKTTSSRTSLVLHRYGKPSDAALTRTNAKAKAYYVPTFVVVSIVFILLSAIVSTMTALAITQINLLDRVSSLEQRLAELEEGCECGKIGIQGESTRKDVLTAERRNNKFAFLMSQGHVKILEANKESKIEEVLNFQHQQVNNFDTRTQKIHPKILTRLEGPESPITPPQIRHHSTSGPVPSDIIQASRERMTAISEHTKETEDRFRRGAKRKSGKKRRDQQSEESLDQRGRSNTRASAVNAEHNSTELRPVRGVHFQANLNRTTTIGVAGWVPYWALSSSLMRSGSQEYTDGIKNEFRLSARGNVTVRTGGLYYIYSQMMYYDTNEYIGHSIVVDGVEAFTCIAPISDPTNKYKTCFIGGLVYVPSRGKVGIKMLYTPRQVCLFEDTSYFGMFRVT